MRNKLIILFIVSIVLISILPKGKIVTAENTNQEIDIALSPVKILFEIDNMKPGDWADRTLTVLNSGTQDFTYASSIHLKAGSEKLYKELYLIVSDADKELFNGKLDNFKGLEQRGLAKSTQENLYYTIEFPSHLGNDFQGLSSEVVFSFYVDRNIGGVLGGPSLPETATNIYNIFLVGLVVLLVGTILLKIRKMNSLY